MTRRRIPRTTVLASVVWLALMAALAADLAVDGGMAGIVFCLASALLWLSGLRTLSLWIRASHAERRAVRRTGSAVQPAPDLRVALLYCVADDADLRAIAMSMRQDVPVATVILDDSTTPASRRRIDGFAATHGCRVIRRAERTGFKAGNLNHGLAELRGLFDAFLVCDSDVVLPPHFVRVCAGSFADPRVAVAQGIPDAGGRTWFARYFGPLLATHVTVTRRGREAHGTVAFLGRGALVRAAALDEVGGFPIAVAEDLALTVALRRRGWRLVNVDESFHEDYPVDYRSFRTQTRKTAEGAVEFLRRSGRVRGLPVREKLDVLLDAALLPTTALAGVTALIAGSALAAAGTLPPPWALVASAGSALAPLLPEAVARTRGRGIISGAMFLALGGALYASSTFVILGSVLRTLVGGRAEFWITPKTSHALGVRQVLHQLRPELVLAPPLMLATVAVSGAPISVADLVWPMLVAVAFLLPALRLTGRVDRSAETSPRRDGDRSRSSARQLARVWSAWAGRAPRAEPTYGSRPSDAGGAGDRARRVLTRRLLRSGA